jgi:hypothetical protein
MAPATDAFTSLYCPVCSACADSQKSGPKRNQNQTSSKAGARMKILAARIKRQLLLDVGKWGRCTIYESELQRIWPLNDEDRETKIAQFARESGFHLSFYRKGLCAIFVKEPS